MISLFVERKDKVNNLVCKLYSLFFKFYLLITGSNINESAEFS